MVPVTPRKAQSDHEGQQGEHQYISGVSSAYAESDGMICNAIKKYLAGWSWLSGWSCSTNADQSQNFEKNLLRPPSRSSTFVPHQTSMKVV
jgi:hypothetical protein